MIERSNVNNSQVRANDFPHSGFDLSYKSRADFILGRLHPINYQYIMPGDKFRASTDVKHTFNTMIVPEISDVNVSLHSFYVTLRSIDNTFIDGITPTELNDMSASWRVPSFNLHDTVTTFISPTMYQAFNDGAPHNWRSLLSDFVQSYSNYEALTYQTFAEAWLQYVESIVPDEVFDITDSRILGVLDAFLTPLFGENSLLDMLGYHYFRRSDILKMARRLTAGVSFDDVLDMIVDTPQCEYALRAYYAIWYEHYRDKQIEKRSSDLPDWRKFGSSSVIETAADVICFLGLRTRSWSEDMFTTSKPDDISRHVFAPVMNRTTNMSVSADDSNYLDAETPQLGVGTQAFHNLQMYNLSFIDPVSGEQKSISCPVPKAVNDVLNNLDTSLQSVSSFGIDLRDLRKSQMLERYLKRNFYFGDEYQDRMLAHYGSKVSDNSIRRPHLLQSDTSRVNPKQEVSSISTSEAPAGTRTATAQDNTEGSTLSFFAEEFGIFITIMSVVPVAQYAGLCPQNLLSQMTDFPIPEFAANNDETGRVCEIAQSPFANDEFNQYKQFGHYPYAHAWRSRVDEVHGSFLSDRQNYSFRRFFGLDSVDSIPKLNYVFLHCLPNLGMFEDSVRLSGQGYFTADNHFYVERVLPTPVEEI